MIRDNAFALAAVAAAILALGGALAIVEAQDPPGADKSPATSAKTKRSISQRSKTPAMSRPPGMGAMPGSMGTMGMSSAGMGGMHAGATAADDDPEMAELAQLEGLLAGQASELITQYEESENAAERKQIAAELRQVLVKQFDVQKQRRELELARIEERVRRLRDQIKKRDDARETIIDRRLAQLIDDAEGLGWTSPAGDTRRSGKTAAGSSDGYTTKRP